MRSLYARFTCILSLPTRQEPRPFAFDPRIFRARTRRRVRATPAQGDRLKEIIAGDHRSAENKARDKYRTHTEKLTFFGIRPDMTVVEIYPGQGWYTEVLARFL